MIYQQIAKQAVDFQKTAFTNWYNAVVMIQDQSASAMEVMMTQSGLAIPETAYNALKTWTNACQEAFKRFHSQVENGFFSIEKLLVKEAKPASTKSPKLLAEEKKATPAKSPKLVVAEKKAAPAQKTSPAAK
jgi:hypothetical protein